MGDLTEGEISEIWNEATTNLTEDDVKRIINDITREIYFRARLSGFEMDELSISAYITQDLYQEMCDVVEHYRQRNFDIELINDLIGVPKSNVHIVMDSDFGTHSRYFVSVQPIKPWKTRGDK